MSKFTFTPNEGAEPRATIIQVMRIASDARQAGYPDTAFEIEVPGGDNFVIPAETPLNTVNIDRLLEQYLLALG